MKSPFSFLRRKKQELLTEQEQSSVDKYEAKLHDKYLSEFNGYVEKHIRQFAKKHRTSLQECDVYQLHNITRDVPNDRLKRFLGYCRGEGKEIVLYFPENSMCLRRHNAFFIVTRIECFPSGKAKISYRTKVRYRIIEHEEIV